jgi:hypothetical protein
MDSSTRASPPRLAARGGEAVELTLVRRDTKPAVWRRIVVPTSLTLRQLHAVLQTAKGWEDYYLHLFDLRGVLYGDVEEFQGEIGDEESFTVGDTAAVAGTWRYQYDFGDGWDHDIRVGQRLASVGLGKPHCVDGARACPPEDCGGAPATSTCWRFWPTLPTPTPSMWPRPTRSSSSTTGTPDSAPGADRRRR